METHQEINQITWAKTLSIWWSMYWRAFPATLVLGHILGIVGGLMVAKAGRPDLVRPVVTWLALLVTMPVSIWALRVTLSIERKDYCVVTVKSS